MSELVADCPRCGSNKITFDLVSSIITKYVHNWQNWYEAFCICRHCRRSTVFVLSESSNGDYKYVHQTGLVKIDGSVNSFVNIKGIISLKDKADFLPPDFVPAEIEAVFREGATCISVGCNNAASTMFRLCIDLITRTLLPEGETEGLNYRTRRDLGLRLPWLFKNNILPHTLEDISTCVREDGNDGAHQGKLTTEDAEDLLDFTTLLLERIYTEPERLKQAQVRRQKRREANA
ncbi:DUF4145 domain-containing protein [Pseudocolwellia agarivorans]|uniref:DUF4145 domain-containing protein n=1 Tax=Pseudocolwellia agarivorans TaxID=1911682 RepID=UPI003F882839